MNSKEDFAIVIDTLLANPLITNFHKRIGQARRRFHNAEKPFDDLDVSGGVAAALVRMQLAGCFDPPDLSIYDNVAPPTDVPPSAISHEEQVALAIPDVGEMLAKLGELDANGLAADDEQSTFIFLTDPQPNRNDRRNDDNPAVKRLNMLNDWLNNLQFTNWPEGFNLSVAGTPFNINVGLIFGGDLCQTGGDYNWADQAAGDPPYYNGGWELEILRHLFQKEYYCNDLTFHSQTTGTIHNAYFGLGNHDVSSAWVPGVWWSGQGWLGAREDYWRWQMWNFICQMHTGVDKALWWGKTDPKFPVTQIDADGEGGIDWKKYSFNYFINLGPVDVYQLHVCGGDNRYGRASGQDWVRDRITERGLDRPVIIVQHYTTTQTSENDQDPDWSKAQRAAFLKFLEPFNVIALLDGHDHEPLSYVPYRVNLPDSSQFIEEFRPGASQNGYFAVARVAKGSFNIITGQVDANKNLIWRQGYSKSFFIPENVILYRCRNIRDNNHFYTTSLSEVDYILQHGYVLENTPCLVYSSKKSDPDHLIPLYRLYNAGVDDHLYTTSDEERNHCINNLKFSDEGIQCYVFDADLRGVDGLVPLYRLYNKDLHDHFYTTSEAENEYAQTIGYQYERVACAVPPYVPAS
jgi:cytolysin (calcineurin-like family phosphatase)